MMSALAGSVPMDKNQLPEKIRIDVSGYRGIVVLTGAGISAASGIRTYRGPDGLWNDAKLVRLSEGETFRREPLEVWRFWSESRRICAAAAPNAAHLALASLEGRLRSDQRLTLITQNIDGLHRRAGSSRVVEFHGAIDRTRCSNPSCGLESFLDDELYFDSYPLCPRCASNLRPDIVLFGEAIPPRNSEAVMSALAGCDLFVAIGTSGTVYPAADFARWAFEGGARTLYLNLESLGDGAEFFREELLGRAEELVPLVFGEGAGRD
jgi:NAD-dependent deacetylase